MGTVLLFTTALVQGERPVRELEEVGLSQLLSLCTPTFLEGLWAWRSTKAKQGSLLRLKSHYRGLLMF